jgi:DNA replication protein DnaC
MTEDTRTKIRGHLATLGLTGMLKALDEELGRAVQQQSPPSELMERLLAVEAQQRIDRRIERRIKEAKLPDRKLLADFDFDFQTGVDKAQILELAKLDFARRKQSLIIAGNSGTGKSHLAKALLLLGCAQQFRCRYTTATDMMATLLASRADDSLAEKLKLYTSPEILLIDEVGFDCIEQQDARQAALFFKVTGGRYCKGSTIMTTNVDFKELGDYLGDPVITTAIVDRLVHHAIIINIQGPSWRMHESKKLNARPGKQDKQPKTAKEKK